MNVLLLGRDDFDYTKIIETIDNNGDECVIITNNSLTDTILYDEKLFTMFDFIISYNFHSIISEDIIERFKNRIINLHISYLPWNRGADPNLWSWIDKTTKGVTIHEIDKGIDTGRILVQEATNFKGEQWTLEETWWTLQVHMQDMFNRHWNFIRTGELFKRMLPQSGKGSFHLRKDRPVLTEGWETKVADL